MAEQVENYTEVSIIGAGPAGLAAAIQLKRCAIPFTLFESQRPGGLLWSANLVENYPGFPSGLPGRKLARSILSQAQHLGVVVLPEGVLALDFAADFFQIHTSHRVHHSQLCVVASGTQAVRLSDVKISQLVQPRLFYEGYPLRNMRGRHIAIIGAGDLAFDYALNLSRRNRVTILNRGDQPSCLPLLWQRAQAVETIQYEVNCPVTEINSLHRRQVSLVCSSAEIPRQFAADFVLIAIGRRPQLDYLAPGLAELLPQLENQRRLYLAGDVKNGIYRQAAIASGDGIMAAMQIYRYLKGDLP